MYNSKNYFVWETQRKIAVQSITMQVSVYYVSGQSFTHGIYELRFRICTWGNNILVLKIVRCNLKELLSYK